MEEAGKASGGAYEFQVEIGNDTGRISLLDADAGGYAENVASAEGLAEITELNEYRYMTALDPGGVGGCLCDIDFRRRGHGQRRWN